MAAEHQIAQLNIARLLYPPDDQRVAEFFARLDEVNALAEASPGFVWRLQSESGNATDIQIDDDPLLIVNMSVWKSVDALFEFAYRSDHTRVLAKRRQWFEPPTEAHQVLWWVPVGHEPTIDDGMERLRHLRAHGPSEAAFTFKSRHLPPGAPAE